MRLALTLILVVTACAADANNCQRQLDLCLRQAPPGASTSECYAQYDACTRMPRRGLAEAEE